MCEFASWIKHKEEVYFLKDSDLETKEGRELVKYLGDKFQEDIPGHGAILHYYPELVGKAISKEECTDFSTPDNFPKEIAEAIKKGQMSRIGICEKILNEKGMAEYEKIKQPAYAEYEKICQFALAEYEKICQSAWIEYKKIQQPVFWKIARQEKYRREEWK